LAIASRVPTHQYACLRRLPRFCCADARIRRALRPRWQRGPLPPFAGSRVGLFGGFGSFLFFGGLRAIARRCPKFLLTESGLGASLTTKVFDASPIAGHRTFQANEAGTIMGFKLGLKLVFTLAGPDVFMTGNVGVFTAPPASPAPRTTMLRLIKRVRAAR
jgi:hypothetical protein